MGTEFIDILNTSMWYFPIDKLFLNNKCDFFFKINLIFPVSQLILLLQNFFQILSELYNKKNICVGLLK